MKYINQLPKSWGDISFETYLKITKMELPSSNLFAELDLNIGLLSILLKVDRTTLEHCSVNEILKLIDVLEFLNNAPDNTKTSLRIKDIKDITYNEFILLEKLKEDYVNNIPRMLSVFCVDNVSPEDILKLDTQNVLGGFFLLRKNSKKFLTRSVISSNLKIVKQKFMNLKAFFFKN